MRYYLDTEFIENGITIDLISIGVVAEDGREFYACSTEARLDLANPWVRQNVLTQLPPYGCPEWMDRKSIAKGIECLIAVPSVGAGHFSYTFRPDDPRRPDHDAQFWAYFADYDWVAFCQLFGTMMDLPQRFPRHCMDLKQWATQLNISKDNELSGWPKQEHGEHNALEDARWNAELYAFLEGKARG